MRRTTDGHVVVRQIQMCWIIFFRCVDVADLLKTSGLIRPSNRSPQILEAAAVGRCDELGQHQWNQKCCDNIVAV